MRINEILAEDDGFNFTQALDAHRNNLHDAGASEEKVRFVSAYITRGRSQIHDAGDFQTWANNAQDAFDAQQQAQRDKGQDKKIDNRPSDVRPDGSKKRASNQYVSRGSWAQKGSSGVKTGIKPVDTGADIGTNFANRITGGITAKSK